MVTLSMRYPHAACAEGSGGFGKFGGGGQRGAGDFEQNPRRCWQRATHSHKRTRGADVQSSSKFQEVFALVITASHENGDGKWKAWPLPAFLLWRYVANQMGTSWVV
jgi:hypothetical protein